MGRDSAFRHDEIVVTQHQRRYSTAQLAARWRPAEWFCRNLIGNVDKLLRAEITEAG